MLVCLLCVDCNSNQHMSTQSTLAMRVGRLEAALQAALDDRDEQRMRKCVDVLAGLRVDCAEVLLATNIALTVNKVCAAR